MELSDKKKIIAVVGVSKDTEKYGYKVFSNLKRKGYNVYPVNPKYEEINGVKCYSSLENIKDNPYIVVSVVPPQVTSSIVKEMKKLDIKNIWMQPGSESEEAIKFCEENKIEAVYNSCIMVETD